MIVQTVLEHWVRIWTRPAPQIIDINEHFARTTAPEMGRLLMFDLAGNSVVLLDLKENNNSCTNICFFTYINLHSVIFWL